MLKQSLFELAIASLLTSQRLAEKLKKRLVGPFDGQNAKAFHQSCLQTLRDELDINHSRRFRLNDIDTALRQICPEHLFTGTALPALDHLFNQLMMRNGDVIHYQSERVQAYARMAANVDPTIIVGWHLATRMKHQPTLSPDDLIRMVDAQQPFYSPQPANGKVYAEGHVHLGGTHYDGVVLISQLVDKSQYSQFDDLGRLSHGLLSEWLKMTVLDQTSDISSPLRHLWQSTIGSQQTVSPYPKVHFSWIAEQTIKADINNPYWLRKQIALAVVDADLGKAWLWFVIWLWHQYQQPNSPVELRMAIFYLLTSLMQQRHQLIMDGQGLTRFVETYNNQLRGSTANDAATISSAKKLFQGRHDVAEIKVTPNAFNPEKISNWLNIINKVQPIGQNPTLNIITKEYAQAQRQQMERWHYCIHFLRKKAYARKRQEIWQEATKLLNKLNQQAGWGRYELLNGHGNSHFHFDPSRWVRGLDVAGDENEVDTEIFSPVLRWLRMGLTPRPNPAVATTGFHLSVHAGEDYNHPASGLRHIDETVQFCQFRTGDRLGHALALGITPQHWVDRQGDILLPVEEHLDNLVWLWHYACELSPQLPLASQVLPKLERRIAQFTPYVPWTSANYMRHFYKTDFDAAAFDVTTMSEHTVIPPATLHNAWFLRRNCYYQLTEYRQSPIIDEKIEAALPDLELIKHFDKQRAEKKQPGAVQLFCQRAELMRSKTAHGKGRIVHIHTNEQSTISLSNTGPGATNSLGMLDDYESKEELDFMYALQDHLLNKYDQLGLIIEANPSSNVYISRLESHQEHPIFRWYPPDESILADKACHNKFGLRKGPIRVCINTDDPGIMPTTLRTEYELLREAAIAHGVSRTAAEQWLERIRLFAQQEFERNHQTVFADT